MLSGKSLKHGRLLAAIIPVFALLMGACGDLDIAPGPVLHNVAIAPDVISPNADGLADATEIQYALRRPANVSIYFEDAEGTRYTLRDERRRAPGDYSLQWGGVIDEPYVLDNEGDPQEVTSHVLPDGAYTWSIAATEEGAAQQLITGTIVLTEGATTLPTLNNFAVVPEVFKPNQDGLRDDWVSVSFYLNTDVESLLVYVLDPANPDLRYFIAEQPGIAKPTERGYHDYRYEGGVDLNAEPPPDGNYAIVAEARDAAGNTVRVSRPLVIEEGGKPRADVAGGEINWEGEVNRVVAVPLDGKLCFTAIVVNEGTVPIRTSGPWPGEEYSFAENSNTLAARAEDDSWFQQAGVWRFGINFDTTGIDFPYRWAVGRKQDLEMRLVDGVEQYYLMPGQRGEVSGCIVIDEEPPVGTTVWWGGLIHQNVAVANNNIDRITVNVGAP